VQGTVLVDGFVRGVWRIDDSTLVVQHAARLAKRKRASVAAEGRRYLRFARPQASGPEVRLVPVS
jgi:hypothetical protein